MLNYGLKETIEVIDSMEDYEIETFLTNWEKLVENEKTYNAMIEDIGRFGFFQYKNLVIEHAKKVIVIRNQERRRKEDAWAKAYIKQHKG